MTAEFIKQEVKELGATVCGIGNVALMGGEDPRRNPFSILPNAKSIIGFGIKVPGGLYHAMEDKRQYYNYTNLGVKYIDETFVEIFLLKMGALIENEGYDACLQRSIPGFKIQGDKSMNPEASKVYELEFASPVAPDKVVPDVLIDFNKAAVICGLGRIGMHGKVIVPKYGSFMRFVFIITDIPLALINVCNLIEEEGFEAIPQRRNQLIMEKENSTNPEVDYSDIYRGVKAENQLDFLNCAVQCGLGEKSMIGSLINKDYGPFIRYCFILTDAELPATPVVSESERRCDNCGECIKACPGRAISDAGETDNWRCAVYYNGANGTKNPFMPPEAFSRFEDRMDIINGIAQFDAEKAKEILSSIYFYPPAKHFYRNSICGRACDRACYIHLEEKGLLGKKFVRKFREGNDWKLSTDQFVTGERKVSWVIKRKEGENE